MPRQSRPQIDHIPQHVVSKFVNNERKLDDGVGRAIIKHAVTQTYVGSKVQVSAFCFMCTHLHWVLTSMGWPIAKLMQPVNSTFAGWWHQQHGGTGPVFAERPWSKAVDSEEGLARLVAYVHNNPVRAGVVSDPADSDWTSHRSFIGEVRTPPWLSVGKVLADIGFSSSPSGRLAFHEFVVSRSHLGSDPSVDSVAHRPGWLNRLQTSIESSLEQNDVESEYSANDWLLFLAIQILGGTKVELAAHLGLVPSSLGRAEKRLARKRPPAQSVVRQMLDVYLAQL